MYLEARVPAGHPLRAIRSLVDEALSVMGSNLSALYLGLGRPSIAPEKLLRAMLLQAFYSIRAERQLMERLEFDLLFRWFVGLGIDDAAWDHSTFSKNRDRLLAGDVAAQFLSAVLAGRRVKRLLSSEHFSVDGTLIQAWALMKSFRPVEEPGQGSGPNEPPPASGGCNADADFRGEKRSNATHASTTDPDAKLYGKGPSMEARLAFLGHALMENRSGLIVDAYLTTVSGHAERMAALAMIEPHADRPRPITLGADRGYDAADFVNELRSMNVRPHVAQNLPRCRGRSAIDSRTTRYPGDAASQRALGGCAGALWPADDDLQSLQPLAQSRRLGSADGRGHKGLRRQGPDDRHLGRASPPTGCDPKKGGRDRCLGRSRGGLTTKIHALVDAHGRPIQLKLTAGQASDIASAADLIGHLAPGAMLLADKGYDANALRALVGERGAWANIPPKSNRKDPICFSRHLYRDRNLIERFLNKIKQFRRVATR